jgi:lipopolysaccharide export system protein LptA
MKLATERDTSFWRRAQGLGMSFGLAGLLISTPGLAFDLDSNIPINVAANSARLDDAKGVATYTGDVELVQGDTKLFAQEVVLYRDTNGLSRIEATGTPAHYVQPTANGKGETDAKALTIIWSAAEKQLTFERDAVIRQTGNIFRGERILYDTVNRVVTAQGSTEAGSGSGRVEMTIQPRSTQESDGRSQSQ